MPAARGHGRDRGYHAGAGKYLRGGATGQWRPRDRTQAASSFNQGDAGGCMRNKDMTQAVAAVVAELKDHLSDIGDKTSSGT